MHDPLNCPNPCICELGPTTETKTLYMVFKRAKNQANEQRKGWRFVQLAAKEDVKAFETPADWDFFEWTVQKVVVDLPE